MAIAPQAENLETTMKNPPNLDFEHLREQIEKIYHTAITSFFLPVTKSCNWAVKEFLCL
ncbi:MAG: hypothetical protein HC840_27595 [Leptolyngbyaceae cyanobacterium RM2_2_4]|nr:hypothetical protein [Leptolyngbyaceae cyanobacterium RM2_2_4]